MAYTMNWMKREHLDKDLLDFHQIPNFPKDRIHVIKTSIVLGVTRLGRDHFK